jgi:hypothetical protein
MQQFSHAAQRSAEEADLVIGELIDQCGINAEVCCALES